MLLLLFIVSSPSPELRSSKHWAVNAGHVLILIIKHCWVADTISQGLVDVFITIAIFQDFITVILIHAGLRLSV